MGIFRKAPVLRARAWLLEKNPSQDSDVVLHTVTTPPSIVQRIDGEYFYDTAVLSTTGEGIETKYLIADYIFETN